MEKSCDTILTGGKKDSELFFCSLKMDLYKQNGKKGELVFIKCISTLRPTSRHLFMIQGWKMEVQKSSEQSSPSRAVLCFVGHVSTQITKVCICLTLQDCITL